MSRLISDILGAPEPHFSHSIRSLEEKTGKSGHDLRLISDITQRRQKALKELNLDVADTTSRELYYALRHRSRETNLQLETELGVTAEDSIEVVIGKVLVFIESLDVPRDVWIIKHSVIKQLLKKQPPKKLMKVLGLRSVDSVLKRSNSYELLALAYLVETPEWSAKMRQQYKKLKPSDFQTSQITVYVIESAKVSKLRKGGVDGSRMLIPNYETGTVTLLPPEGRFVLDTLALTLSILQSLYDARIYGAYFRYRSVKSQFGAHIFKALTSGFAGELHSSEMSWRILQQHFNNQPASFDQIEQPHLQYEDVAVVEPISAIAQKIPDFTFWLDTTYVFAFDGKAVSLHLMDIVLNASNDLSYEQSSAAYLRARLWEELGQRYLQHSVIEAQVLAHIEGDSVT